MQVDALENVSITGIVNGVWEYERGVTPTPPSTDKYLNLDNYTDMENYS